MSLDTMLATLGSATAARLLGAWVTVSLKGSVLIVVAWIVTRAIRRGSAAVRHAIWTSALAGMLVLPILAGVVPRIELAGLPDVRLPRSSAVGQRAGCFRGDARVAERGSRAGVDRLDKSCDGCAYERTGNRAGDADAVHPRRGLDAWLPFVLILGVALLLVRAAAGVVQLSIWTRRASAVHDAGWLSLAQRLAYGMGISRPVTLLRSDRACVPMTWGVVYPRVLLPADADAWTPDRRTIVLLHELAHVKRLDAFTQFVAQLSVVVFWFNPIVWFAARQMRIEREHACDDFVLDAGARASDYANDLLQIARSLVTSGAPAAAALAMARRTELEGRLLAILNPRLNRRPVSWRRLAASSLGVFALAFPLAALRPAASATTGHPERSEGSLSLPRLLNCLEGKRSSVAVARSGFLRMTRAGRTTRCLRMIAPGCAPVAPRPPARSPSTPAAARAVTPVTPSASGFGSIASAKPAAKAAGSRDVDCRRARGEEAHVRLREGRAARHRRQILRSRRRAANRVSRRGRVDDLRLRAHADSRAAAAQGLVADERGGAGRQDRVDDVVGQRQGEPRRADRQGTSDADAAHSRGAHCHGDHDDVRLRRAADRSPPSQDAEGCRMPRSLI